MTDTLKGACLCGSVEYEVKDPEALGYCHCTRCQRWTGSSLAGVVVAKENFKFTKGEDLVDALRERVRAAQLLQQLRIEPLRRPRREVLRRRGADARPRPRAELPPPGRLQGQLARDRRQRSAVRRERLRPGLPVRPLRRFRRGGQPSGLSRASSRVGSNSSTGLPDGSSTRICLPPTPVTMSLRKRAPAVAQLLDRRVEVVDLEREAVPAAGRGHRAVGHRLAAAAGPPPGALSTSRRSPRESIAKVGAGCMTSLKPRCRSRTRSRRRRRRRCSGR